MSGRDIKITIASDDEFFAAARILARQLDSGWRPDKPSVRLCFDDLPTLLRYLHPQALRTTGGAACQWAFEYQCLGEGAATAVSECLR